MQMRVTFPAAVRPEGGPIQMARFRSLNRTKDVSR